MAKNSQKGRNKSRSPAMARYVAENRQEKNRIKRIKKHLKNQPLDLQAQKSL